MENKPFVHHFMTVFLAPRPPFVARPLGGGVASVPHPLIGACWYSMRVDERENILLQKGHVRFVLSPEPVERSRLSHRSMHAKWTSIR